MTTISERGNDPLSWGERSSSLPSLPGRTNNWLPHLAAVLASLEGQGPLSMSATLDLGYTSEPVPVALYADKLAPARLAVRDRSRDSLAISADAALWLQGRDSHDLLRHFHRNVRFIGELLALMVAGPITLETARVRANTDYELGWNTAGQIRDRLKWFEQAGAARPVHDHQWVLTPGGRTLLASLDLAPPTRSAQGVIRKSAPRIAPAGPVITARLSETQDPSTSGLQRRGTLGYIPTDASRSPLHVLRTLAIAAEHGITKREFEEICTSQYGTSRSSAHTALSSLRTAGILQPIDLDVFATTEAAREWLASGDDLNLIRLLHSRLIFVGELLSLVGSNSRAPELHRTGREQFGIRSKESASTASMLRLMKHVGVIRPTGWAQFAITPEGEQLAFELSPPASTEDHAMQEEPAPAVDQDLWSLRQEIREASVDSKNSARFEKALASAFRALGLAADHIGGPGNTDVLVKIGLGHANHGTAVVDAKTSSLGQIQESTISLDAIDDHRKANGCEYAAVLAPGYGSDRLREWAIERHIALLTVDEMDLILEQHLRTPLQPSELVALFKPGGLEIVAEHFRTRSRWLSVISAVVDCFARLTQDEDPEIGTSLDTKLLYWELKNRSEQRPTIAELESVLEFLSAPFINMLARTKTGFVLLESPVTTRRRLEGIAAAMAGTLTSRG